MSVQLAARCWDMTAAERCDFSSGQFPLKMCHSTCPMNSSDRFSQFPRGEHLIDTVMEATTIWRQGDALRSIWCVDTIFLFMLGGTAFISLDNIQLIAKTPHRLPTYYGTSLSPRSACPDPAALPSSKTLYSLRHRNDNETEMSFAEICSSPGVGALLHRGHVQHSQTIRQRMGSGSVWRSAGSESYCRRTGV